MKKLFTIISITLVSLLCFVGCFDPYEYEYNLGQDEERVKMLTYTINLEQGEKFVDLKFSGRYGFEFVVTRKRYENEQPETFKIKNINTGKTIVIIEN